MDHLFKPYMIDYPVREDAGIDRTRVVNTGGIALKFAEEYVLDELLGMKQLLSGCGCEFAPDPDDPDEESYHFRRQCPRCQALVWSLHCIHDGVQSRCSNCNERLPSTSDPSPAELVGPKP